MALKLILGVFGGALFIIFIAPIVLKLKLVALTVVVVIGIVLMGYDLWTSAHEDDS
jgi:hypothetical protein